jgi:hypothetical protein
MFASSLFGLQENAFETFVAEDHGYPYDNSEQNWEYGIEQWSPGAHIARNGPAEVAGEQYRSQKRGARYQVQNSANQQRYAYTHDCKFGIAKPGGGLDYKGRLEQLHASVHKQKQGGHRGQNSACPDSPG